MSRAWMPLYVGDYLRDTAHLTTEQHGAYMLLIMHCWEHERIPATSAGRAAVARVTPRRWSLIGKSVEAFFREDGSHKRVEEERVKSDKALMQRRIAAAKGGMHSAIARAKGQPRARPVAQAVASVVAQAEVHRQLNSPRTNHISKNITTTSSVAPREESSVEGAKPPESGNSMGASGKAPAQTSREELEAMFAAKRREPAA